MPRLSKSNKILWGFFWNPATGRRTITLFVFVAVMTASRAIGRS